MNRRLVFYSIASVSCLSVGILCGGITATRAESPKRISGTSAKPDSSTAAPGNAPAPIGASADTAPNGELNRLSEQEKALLGSDKQSPQKTITGLSAQVEVLQMQQEKLVEELVKYRRLAREAKSNAEATVPAFGEDKDGGAATEKPRGKPTRREQEAMNSLATERLRSEKLEAEITRLEKQLELSHVPTKDERETHDNELRLEREHGQKLEKEIAQLEEKLRHAREKTSNAEGIEEQLQEKDERIRTLEAKAERAEQSEKDLEGLRAELEKTKRSRAELEAKVQDQEQLIAGIPALRRQLQEAKNQLLMKQTEMQLMAKATGGSPSASLQAAGSAPTVPAGRASRASDAQKQLVLDEVMENSGRIAGEEAIKGKPAKEAVVVQVTAPKVNLRSGPGNENAPVMQVQRGSRLTVESREGEWLRVVTPTGSRAYIMNDVVSQLSPDGTARAQVGSSFGARRPQKQVARAIVDDSLEAFGSPKSPAALEAGAGPGKTGAAPKDDVDRAFQKLKLGPQADPNVPPETSGE